VTGGVSVDDDADKELQVEIQEVLAELFAHRGGNFLTRYVLLAEVMEEDGGKATWMSASPGMKSWETYGFLRFGLAHEDAAITADAVRGD
jgi:hypothetical protein